MARALPTPSPPSWRNPALTGGARSAATCSSTGQWARATRAAPVWHVRSTHPNSIGYLDLVQALAAKLQVASVQNTSGRFVAPSGAVQAAMASASWDPATQFNALLVNMAGEGSYPIVAVVFGLASDRSAQRPQTARASSSGRSRAVAPQPRNSATWPCRRRQCKSTGRSALGRFAR